MNKMKQIALATHNYASANETRLPVMYDKFPVGPLFISIMPHLEQNDFYAAFQATGNVNVVIPAYVSPADPTMNPPTHGVTSYAANAVVFMRSHLENALNNFPDGLSNTIWFAEHYAHRCGDPTAGAVTSFGWSHAWNPETFVNPVLNITEITHRPTFADTGDVTPVTRGDPPVTAASVTGRTFQARPAVRDCNPTMPQAPHNSLLVALGDGSVRLVSPGVSEATFWAAVTPAGGETLGADW